MKVIAEVYVSIAHAYHNQLIIAACSLVRTQHSNMKRDHFTRLINLQNGSSNPEKKKKKKILNFFFLTCTRSRAFQLAPRQISPEVSLVWLS